MKMLLKLTTFWTVFCISSLYFLISGFILAKIFSPNILSKDISIRNRM